MAAIDDFKLAGMHKSPSTFQTFQFIQSFTRPSDAIAYSVGDAINNSTSAPVILSQDITPQGIPIGAFVQLSVVRIITTSTTQLENMNLLISGTPFTPSNDNAAQAVPLALLNTGQIGVMYVPGGVANSIPLINGTMTEQASGYTDRMTIPTGILYATLSASAARTPVSGETFTVIIFGRLL